MKHCSSCNIDVETTRMTCPLCREVLNDVNDKEHTIEYYQDYKEKPTKSHLVRRIFLFLSIVSIAICVLINWLTFNPSKSYWSLIVIGSILYLWVLVKGTIMSRRNIALKLFLQAFTIGVLLTFIQLQDVNNQWMIPYVLPFIMIATMMAITLLILIKSMRYRDYMLYLIMVVLMGFIPIILALVKTTQFLFTVDEVVVIWPSICACSYSVVTLLGMFLFGDRATKNEFKKRFHI